MKNLSPEDIQFLIEFGFIQNASLYSGYYYHQDDESSKVSVLIAHDDGSYKMEFYEFLPDGNGDWYEEFSRQNSQPNQSLVEFIKSIFE